MTETVHQHAITLNNGDSVSLSDYAGKVLLIVNTASKCGFTPQYDGLEKLHQDFNDKGLVILGFPCNQFGGQEPGNDQDIAQFCSLNFSVSFALSQKVDVNGDNAAPLYKTLKQEAPGVLGSERIKWNFTKFLVGKNGEVLGRFAPTTKPHDLINHIETALNA